MARRWLLSMVVLMMLSMGAGAASGQEVPPGGSFLDDDDNIHQADIEAIAGEGIARGCNPEWNDRFCPDETVSRGQVAAFMVRALGLVDAGGADFTDDDGSVFEGDIERLAAAGVTRGCNPPVNDRFCPDEPLTRGQMAAFLARAFGFPAGGDYFVDDDGSVFEAEINALASAGVSKGCDPPTNRRFCPHDPVTRGQMASFLTRALHLAPLQPPERQVVFTPDTGINFWYDARTGEDEVGTYYERYRLWDRALGCEDGNHGPCTIDISVDNAEVWVKGPDGTEEEMASRLLTYPIRFIPSSQGGVYEFTFRLNDGTTHRAIAEIEGSRSVPLVATGATRREGDVVLTEFSLGELDLRQATSVFHHQLCCYLEDYPTTERNFWLDLESLETDQSTFMAKVDGRWYYAEYVDLGDAS